jgi:hypothetical protein
MFGRNISIFRTLQVQNQGLEFSVLPSRATLGLRDFAAARIGPGIQSGSNLSSFRRAANLSGKFQSIFTIP